MHQPQVSHQPWHNGSVYRECTVVWRTEDTLGVQFSRVADAPYTSYLQPGVRFTGFSGSHGAKIRYIVGRLFPGGMPWL